MNKPKRQMNLPDRIRITTNGDCMNGIEILDLDTGKDIIYDLKNITVRDMKIDLGPRGVEAEVRFYVAKGGSMVEFVEHYGIGEVELGDFDARKSNIALEKMHVNGFAIVDDPVNPRAKIDTRHPDAKLPCPECGDKGYVDLATSRQPCRLCKGNGRPKLFSEGGVICGMTRFHENDLAGEILMPKVNPEKKLGVLGPGPVTIEGNVQVTYTNDALLESFKRNKDLIRRIMAGKAYFSTEGEARGAAMQALCSREELQGIDRHMIFNVVEDWVADLMDCEDRQEFEDFCCDMSDEVLGEIAEEDGSGFRKDPLPTEDLVKAAVAIFDYCVLCGRNTKNANRRCDPCFEKMERQVMDLAKDQIARGLVKAGDKVRIAFDPGNVNVVATILTRPDGTLEAELDHVRKEKVQLAYRKEKSLGVLPKPAAPPAVPEAETCDECYGTGFKGGWGAPCSKGCKPKK